MDFGRISDMVARTRGATDVCFPGQLTPFAAPLFLEIGKVPVQGAGAQKAVQQEAERLMQEAGITQ